MIEIEHRIAPRNVKQYRWKCTMCNPVARSSWFDSVSACLDNGAQHLETEHSKERL